MEHGKVLVEEVTRSHGALVPYLFPQARDVKATPALFAAFAADRPDSLLGLALLSSPIGAEDSAFRFGLEVMAPWRNQGIGAQLLRHVIEVADSLNAPSLRNMQPVRSTLAHRLLTRFGFSPLRMTVSHEFPLDTAFVIFDRQLDNLLSAGRIPSAVSSAAYAENKDDHALSALCRKEFGSLTYGHLEALGEYPAPDKDYSFSRAFWLDGNLLGAWAVAVKNGTATFDPLLIAPGKRNTWVFTYVIHSVLQELIRHGVNQGGAQIHQDNLKMMSLMRRIGAKAAGVDTLYELALPRSPSGSGGAA